AAGVVFDQAILQDHEDVAVGQPLHADRIAADGEILDDAAFAIANADLGALELCDHDATLALLVPHLSIDGIIRYLVAPLLLRLLVESRTSGRHAAADHAILLLHNDGQSQERWNLVELREADRGMIAQPFVPRRVAGSARVFVRSQGHSGRLVTGQANQDFL